MKVVANIDFDGDCREALPPMPRILGGEIRSMISHRDMPEMAEGAGEDRLNCLVHAWIDIGDQALMGQDMQDFSGRKGYSVAIAADSVEEARCIFEALSDEGGVLMPSSRSHGRKASAKRRIVSASHGSLTRQPQTDPARDSSEKLTSRAVHRLNKKPSGGNLCSTRR